MAAGLHAAGMHSAGMHVASLHAARMHTAGMRAAVGLALPPALRIPDLGIPIDALRNCSAGFGRFLLLKQTAKASTKRKKRAVVPLLGTIQDYHKSLVAPSDA